MNTKASNKAKKHNYIPLDANTIQKIKKKHRCWTRYRETGDKKSIRNMPKQEIKLKAQSEKQKLIWRNKLHKMLRAIRRCFGNMLTPKEKLPLVYQSYNLSQKKGKKGKQQQIRKKQKFWLASSVAYSQLNRREIYH